MAKILKKSELTLDEWFSIEFSDVEYIGYIKPLILKNIAHFVLNVSAEDPLNLYLQRLNDKPDSKKKDCYTEVIAEIKSWKELAQQGDPIAKMRLVNNGFIRRK